MNTQLNQSGVVDVPYCDDIVEELTGNQSSQVVTSILSFEEERDRLYLEKKVERAFYQAGKALKELHSRKLYRSTYKTFEEYCKDRFGFERRHSYRLIEAAGVIDNLIEMCPNGTHSGIEAETFVLPTSERQVRALVPLVPSEQFDCWQEAVNVAGGKVPSGRIVKDIVERIRERTLIPINHSIGEVCIIIIKGNPELQGKSGHWCIINHVASFSYKVKTWDGEYIVKPENLRSLDFSESECLVMSDICFRLRRLYNIENLDEVALSLLNTLGKRAKPYLTPVQEKILALIEDEYGIK